MTSSEHARITRGRREYSESDHASVVIAGVIVAVLGWPGLGWLVANTVPTVPYRWLFFALFQIALVGTALPFIRFLHQRFGRRGGAFASPAVLARQAAWVGLFGTICLWLRIPRLLSIWLALIVFLALAAVETLLQLREQMQWRPE